MKKEQYLDKIMKGTKMSKSAAENQLKEIFDVNKINIEDEDWKTNLRAYNFKIERQRFKVLSDNGISERNLLKLKGGEFDCDYVIIYNTINTDTKDAERDRWILEEKKWFQNLGDDVKQPSQMYAKVGKERQLDKEDFTKRLREIIENIPGKDILKMDNKQNDFGDLYNLVENGATQIILTGAPGTGKTRLAKEVAKEFAKNNKKHLKENDPNSDDQKKDDSNSDYQLVQFHPSYDYTDFVEGLRPVEDAHGKVEFRKLDGIFKKFCRKVVERNESDKNQDKYFFIVDEINRADLSKVFGELMFCLESDKRGPQNSVQTQYANLRTYDPENGSYYSEGKKDVFKDGFYIPENVIVIGTMNDIDRSVESMDFALRRRFIWKEIEVEKATENLKKIIQDMLPEEAFSNCKVKDAEFSKIAEYISFVNKKIEDHQGLNRHYDISQGQFANVPGINNCKNADELIQQVWNLRLESLLYEYVRGEGNEKKFVNECNLEAFKEWEKVQNNAQNNTPSEEKE